MARAASGFLGALAVPLTAIAGARLFEDKRVGFIAGALLAVAFLPVHYGHFALNDAPTLAPLALSLVGVAGIYRTGRMREYVIAGVGLGLAIATKYQAGIVVVTIVAAAFASPGRPQPAQGPRVRVRADAARVPGREPVRAAGPRPVHRRPAEADVHRGRQRGRREAGSRADPRAPVLPADVHVGLRLAAFAARPGRDRRADRAPPAAGDRARPGADPAAPVLRQQLALLRALDAADVPDPGDVGGVGDRRAGRALAPARARPRARRPGAAAAARVQRPQRRRARPRRHASGRARLDAAATSRSARRS